MEVRLSATNVEILYESGPCLVVLKPAGLATQAAPGIDSMEVRVKQFLKAREGLAGDIYLGVPHRLDRPVSGVLLLARHTRAARRISKQFENREVRKVYWACVAGQVEPPAGTWCDQIKKIYGHPRAEIVPPDDPEGRAAVLHYRARGQTPWGSWLEIELETGRTHQIRVQAASRGWPVLGDAFYGSTIPFGIQHEDERLRSIALHGRSIGFRHPMTREEVTVEAPLPLEWRALELGSVAV
jgi:23S rRNA pseudouridine1911/1915/1917 synthase